MTTVVTATAARSPARCRIHRICPQCGKIDFLAEIRGNYYSKTIETKELIIDKLNNSNELLKVANGRTFQFCSKCGVKRPLTELPLYLENSHIEPSFRGIALVLGAGCTIGLLLIPFLIMMEMRKRRYSKQVQMGELQPIYINFL